MPQFVSVVALIAYFTELTCISHGECNDGNLQKSVYCSTKRFEKVSCRVEGIVMITNMTINQQNQTKSCSLSAHNGDPNYGINENVVWVDNGCSAVFEVCGKTNKSFSSETVVPSTSSTAHVTISTAGSILPTGATEYSHSNPFTSSPTAQSLKTTDTTKGVQITAPVQLTTVAVTVTPEMPTVDTEIDATLLSETTQAATNGRSLSTESVSTTAHGTSSFPLSSSTTVLMSTSSTTKPMSALTTAHSLNAASTTGSSSLNTTHMVMSSVSTPISAKPTTNPTIAVGSSSLNATHTMYSVSTPISAKPTTNPSITDGSSSLNATHTMSSVSTPISAKPTTYGHESIPTSSSGLSSPKTTLTPSSTTPKPTSTETAAYGYDSNEANGTTASTMTPTFRMTGTVKYRSEITPPMNSTTLNRNGTGSKKTAADMSPQHDETNTLSTGAIAGIIAGGCVFILLCVLYVYILSSFGPCNSVTPSSRV